MLTHMCAHAQTHLLTTPSRNRSVQHRHAMRSVCFAVLRFVAIARAHKQAAVHGKVGAAGSAITLEATPTWLAGTIKHKQSMHKKRPYMCSRGACAHCIQRLSAGARSLNAWGCAAARRTRLHCRRAPQRRIHFEFLAKTLHCLGDLGCWRCCSG